MLIVPLSIAHFVSFLVLGRILGRGTVLSALASTGIAFGSGMVLIGVHTTLITFESSLIRFTESAAVIPLFPLHVFVLFVPVTTLYRMPSVRAVGTTLLAGLASIGVLALVPILIWIIRLFPR